MARIPLTDGSGRWFDSAKTESFDEDTYWNGNNHISRATGSQWDHERLLYTAGKKWILETWSQWQGVGETFTEISDEDAAKWMVLNGHGHPVLEEKIDALEIK